MIYLHDALPFNAYASAAVLLKSVNTLNKDLEDSLGLEHKIFVNDLKSDTT